MTERPFTESREQRRRAILDSAVRVFAEHGFFAARIRDIAAGAGVAEGTIYLYFEGKDDLLLTAFREKVNEFVASVREVTASELPFEQRLARFAELQFQSIEAEPPLAMVLLLESRQSSKFYGGAVRDVLRTYAQAIDTLLAGGVERGELRADTEIPLARRMLIGALEEIELEWLLGERTRPLAAIAPRFAAAFYRGIVAGG
ncbi:MAG TPA: TetR/AcrR family transcriptional regulator [Longimicrobium sp.]|jgi:TetR/AcrR family fatty acid metabolism transcriptional regulator|uniref:TetR/AcrR family transcriptional regulator n=1 Tax=Longimicrobium sp. TaxID=2029185 RepID=UPI002ED8D5DE